MSTLLLKPLPIARFRFEVRASQDFTLPLYAGSMLRGAFGHALRRLSCMTRQPSCDGCLLYAGCPYTRIFERRDAQLCSNTYVIEAPDPGQRRLAAGEHWHFNLVLFGDALQQVALIFLAWEQALARGLSKHNIAMQLHAVYDTSTEQLCYQPGGQINAWQTVSHPTTEQANKARLRFLTPLRLQQHGSILGPQQITAPALLMALARRYSTLASSNPQDPGVDFKRLKQQAQRLNTHTQLRWLDWQRYSNRQQQVMPLGGVVGNIELTGDLNELWPLLQLGQWLHIGKSASFGLGRYLLNPHYNAAELINDNPYSDRQCSAAG
ncbi:CRISPR-associated protein Cas6 [Bacterioplanes sanyensis]|uniref:CRISPR system precrRNA processing endoribonuclease RAMP protein Cas6 n=1 Tax=Bacterioplanes sanyensis TaxID=1249553 RepID=UPI00167A4E41|nr:CRISPR system precrRNA processing endoribonuclease RAMP protein Cas6 [Bacterioplanes sanyensis]GGY39110.1 CRISPR-associated protein Cas6 [Bacterioplanes sanyensis]